MAVCLYQLSFLISVMNYLRRSDLGEEIWFCPLEWRDTVHHSRGGVLVHTVQGGACGSCPSHLSGPAPDTRQETGWAQNPQSLFSKVPLLRAGPHLLQRVNLLKQHHQLGNNSSTTQASGRHLQIKRWTVQTKWGRGVFCCPFILVFFAACSWGSILIFKGELNFFLLKIQFTKHLDILSQGLAKRNCLGDVIWLIV